MGNPQHWIHADCLSEHISAANTELVNRPAIGLSEFSSVLENLELVLTEGLAAKIFHPELVAKFTTQYNAYDMGTATKVLNSISYPNQARFVSFS